MNNTRRKLKDLYEVAGFTKQAHSDFMKHARKEEQASNLVLNAVMEVRKMHPVMGLKKIYHLLMPDWIGRDKFIDIGMFYGLGAKVEKNFRRTTFSTKSRLFINLLSNLPIIDINQVWASDTTYFRVLEVFYYLTFILDVYSRRILGYIAWPDLTSEANCRVLQQAIKGRGNLDLAKLIHHSDRGSQYASSAYLKILIRNKIGISMCDSVYENTHIERVNGIIKNEYLKNWNIMNYKDLVEGLCKAVNFYNYERPHWSIGAITPVEYEERLKSIPKSKRKILNIYSEKKNYYVQQQLFN